MRLIKNLLIFVIMAGATFQLVKCLGPQIPAADIEPTSLSRANNRVGKIITFDVRTQQDVVVYDSDRK